MAYPRGTSAGSSTGGGSLACNGRSDLAGYELMYGWLQWPRVWSTVRTVEQITEAMNANVSADADGYDLYTIGALDRTRTSPVAVGCES